MTRPPKPSAMSVADRITEYLSGGGLFNPEYANHDAVRDLLIDCRNELGAIEARTVERCIAWLTGAQVDESGRLILTRDFIVANLRALPRASERRIRGERRNQVLPMSMVAKQKRSGTDRRKGEA